MSAFSLIGQLFDGRYVIERQIGSGGMADVYLATDQSLGRKVAIKILSDRYARDAAFIERFRREAAAAASLRHPNIVTVYDRGEAMGTSYIAMEYLDGPTLKEEITRRAPLPEPEAIGYATQALAALEAAHRQGVIHRDVKPHNMVLTDEGRLKVTDFGIARAANTQQMTEVGSIVGTAQYLSPEQARGLAVGPESDIYSMGVVLYEMLCGDLPFTGDVGRRHRDETGLGHAAAAEPAQPARLAGDGAGGDAGAGQGPGAAVLVGASRCPRSSARVSRGQSASADTQQATRVIAAGEATRVIGGPPRARRASCAPPPPRRPSGRLHAEAPGPGCSSSSCSPWRPWPGSSSTRCSPASDKTVPQSVIGQTCKQAMRH